MEQYGNTTTYNVESVLQKNVVNSEYFRDTCMKLSTWEEVVDEIFYSVSDVEPWMSGNARGASTAFCLLYRSVHYAPYQWPRTAPMRSTFSAPSVVRMAAFLPFHACNDTGVLTALQ